MLRPVPPSVPTPALIPRCLRGRAAALSLGLLAGAACVLTGSTPAHAAPPAAGPADAPAPAAAATPVEGSQAPEDAPESGSEAPATVQPPRVDGTFIAVSAFGTLTFARINDFEAAPAFYGFGGTAHVGETVLPWLAMGVQLTGSLGWGTERGRSQRLGQGGLLVEAAFMPLPPRPFSIRLGLGAGGGAVREEGRPGRSGFGGALFSGVFRYEFFPVANRKRPRRAGGFAIGPELGWLGFTPVASGRPMSHTILLGFSSSFYFGR